jgi:hypothetical protein
VISKARETLECRNMFDTNERHDVLQKTSVFRLFLIFPANSIVTRDTCQNEQ